MRVGVRVSVGWGVMLGVTGVRVRVGQGVRVGVRVLPDGTRERVSRVSGETLPKPEKG